MADPTNRIFHYKTGIQGRTPAVTSLSAGMLAVNYYDGKIFTLQEQGSQKEVLEFLPGKYQPYSLNLNTSSINVSYDTNIITGYYSNINGGYGNRVSGSGSVVAGGENNNIDSDLSLAAGINNDTKGYINTFLLGSGLSAIQANTTYVNNLSAQSKIYGNGSNLTSLNASNISSGVLAVTAGGTGSSTISDAKYTFGGTHVAVARTSTNITVASAGTLTGATWANTGANGAAVVNFATSTVTPVVGMSVSGSGLSTLAIRSVDSSTQFTMNAAATVTNSSGTGITLFNSTPTTLVSSNTTAIDGKTVALNDLILLNQTSVPQSGPWIVTGGVGTAITLTRPSWFSGNLLAPVLVSVSGGSNFIGYLYLYGLTNSGLTTQVGLEAVTTATIGTRGNNNAATGSINTFSNRQIFAGNTTTVNPFSFGTYTSLLNPVVNNAVEWDGTLMYVTTNAGTRTTNAAFVSVPATAASSGVAGQIAYDSTGIYVCVATNTWRKAALTTF
jgi:hypothetical protein